MSEKPQRRSPNPEPQSDEERARVRRDLERRGVDADFARALLPRVEELRASLPAGAYAGVLAGVSLAYAAHREKHTGPPQESEQMGELQELMRAFVGELQKVDEALQLLFVYLKRMRTRAQRDPDDTLH